MQSEVLRRFLCPAHALGVESATGWPVSGRAETPGEDAHCRIFLAFTEDRRLASAFAAFGPPVVIACADWVCERVAGQDCELARGLAAAEIEQALALTPIQRYAGVLTTDALNNALVQLER